MRIMTFNLRCDFILDINNRWTNRKDMVINIIKKYKPDIIGVQELTNVMHRELVDVLDEYYVVGTPRSKKMFVERNDIFISREFHVEEYKTFWLSNTPQKISSSRWYSVFPRICTAAVIRDNNGNKYRICNSHLDFLFTKSRVYEVRKILSFIENEEGKENLPTILMGDFNASPNSKVIEEIRKYILGSALGLLLFQRNIIALHGSSIVINNNAIIISGNIGAGKTSTTLSLVNKGYSFLTDDVASVIKDINGTYNVHHCIPYQKLCFNTIESLGYDKNKLIQIDKIKNKYYSPEIINFTKEPKKLKSLFYLTTSNNLTTVSCSEVFGVEKFKLILSNIFRKELIPNELIKGNYIKEVLNLSKNISVYKITRPKNGNSVEKIVNIIEKYACN